MSNQTRKNKKVWQWSIAGLLVLLVIAFFLSQGDKKVDPNILATVEVSEPVAHVKGNADSEITLVEYSDFQCPACKSAAPQIKSLIEEFGDKFQLEYRHFPLRSIHPNAQISAQAAEAAGMQGKFWEMHDKLFEKQEEWSESFNPKKFFKQYAEEIGINGERLIFDLESDKVKEIVNAQFDEATSLGLPGTPSFVLNGEKIDINTFITEYLTSEEPGTENKTTAVSE